MNILELKLISNKQSGVSLIEVLISMFVLAVGILGVVSLQAVSVKSGVTSTHNARAQMMTDDLVNRLNANVIVDIATNTVATDYVGTFSSALAEPSTLCDTTTCSAQELAAYDLWQISSRMSNDYSLRDGEFQITWDAVNSAYGMGITWNSTEIDSASYTAPDCENIGDNENPGCLFTVVNIFYSET